MTSRRQFLGLSAMGMVSLGLSGAESEAANDKTLKAPRLKKGDKVALVSPAFAAFNRNPVDIKKESLEALGLEVVLGQNFFNRYGYLAGTDEERAYDINAAFKDPSIKAVIAHSGGWGCARILPYLDYEQIRKNPKVVLGFSDITALLLGIHSQTGLITFHGPCPRNKVSADYTSRLIFNGEAMHMKNPVDFGENLADSKHRTLTLHAGKARGRLVGGNLTVLSAIVGSPYLPNLKDAILFLEDVEEQIYRVDRMLTHLKLAGLLKEIRGFVFGKCSRCGPGERYGSLTLQDVLEDHIRPLGVPAFEGFMVGHIKNQFTLPIGAQVEVNADQGTVSMLESPVA